MMRNAVTSLLTFAAVLLTGVGAQAAQNIAPATQPAATQPADAIQTHDLLLLSIPDFGTPAIEFRKAVRVDAAGEVPLPLVPRGVKVAGLSLAQAEAAIGDALRVVQAIRHAAVSIDRVERGDVASVKPGPIAPGDVVRFSFWELSGQGVDYVRTLHVSEAGNIGLPFLGQTKVAGLTEAQAEAAIARAYEDQQIMRGPIISVLRIKPPASPLHDLRNGVAPAAAEQN